MTHTLYLSTMCLSVSHMIEQFWQPLTKQEPRRGGRALMPAVNHQEDTLTFKSSLLRQSLETAQL
jgi:hypothetical protein